MSDFDWPLNDSHFTMWDRIRIAKFFLNPKNRWTQGELVKKYEEKWRDFVGSKYAVMTSSGSTANTLMAMYVKDSLGREFRTRNRVILPAVTWQTSASPWIREGFKPIFIDIDDGNLCMNMFKAHEAIEKDPDRVACVFPTSLLGMNCNMQYLRDLRELYPKIKFMLDNCENSFGINIHEGKNISGDYTSSTSMYFGHQTTTGGEGGMIFTNDQKEYEYFLMARNHGMVRSLYGYSNTRAHDYGNPKVDMRFDFNLLGNNFRSTDIAAFIGLLDFEKIEKHKRKRGEISKYFTSVLSPKFVLPLDSSILFALPFIPSMSLSHLDVMAVKIEIEFYCKRNKIEYRPIISGNLLEHTAYKNYKQGPFPIAEHVHKYGLYVGLYPNLDKEKLKKLITFVNRIL